MAKTLTQEGAGQLLLDNLYKRFGLPDEMLSDRGPQFATKAFRRLLKLLGIKSNLTTAYYPQKMVPLNESIRKLKLICRFIAPHTLRNGKIPYPHWNLPITINDMLIRPTLHEW
jgi:transposase InsO family protein